MPLFKVRPSNARWWFQRNNSVSTDAAPVLPLQSNIVHLTEEIDNHDLHVSTVSCSILPVNDELEVERNESFYLQNDRVDSHTREMPSLYWNELTPPWLIRHMEQKQRERINTETVIPAKWAFPVSSSIPTEDIQDPDKIEVIVEDPIISETAAAVSIESPIKISKPSAHLEKYLNLMYFFCTAPIQCNGKQSTELNQSWTGILLRFLHKAFFCVIVSSAVFDAACQAKFHMLWFFAGEGFNQLVKFIFSVVTITTALYGAQLLSQHQEIGNMLNIMNEFEANNEYETWIPHISLITAVTTALMAFIQPLLYYGMWDHSAIEVVYLSSYELGQDIYIWDWKSMNITEYKVFDSFTKRNAINFVLGSVKMSRDFFSNLLMGMLWDLISIVVVVLFCWRQWFIRKHLVRIKDNIADLNADTAVNLQAEREMVWKKSRKYAGAFQSVNQVFGPFLPFFHVRHVLMCAYFLSICILPDENNTAIVYLFYLYTIMKAEAMYIISAKIDEQNEMHRKFLRHWGLHTGKVIVEGQEYDLQALLGELEAEPLVFGSGSFAINQRFHFGLLGLVSSLFVSLANGIGKVAAA